MVKESVVVAGKLTALAVCMFAFGYAMVPLYEKFCEATGINNLLNPAQGVEKFTPTPERTLRVEFVTNSRGQVGMTPNMEVAEFVTGKTYSVIYTLSNLTDDRLIGQAVPAYAPVRGERWFKKLQCFCFDQLKMAASEVRQVPVVFVIDPEIPEDIETLSLSYTFFEIPGAGGSSSGAGG
jgi:cytochrome c oxidase assembly protein subunit 11